MDDRTILGLRVCQVGGGLLCWETPDLSQWRLVGDSQLQRYHAEATPAPAWLAYHAGVRMDLETAVGYSLGYSRAAMLRRVAETDSPASSPDDDDDDDDDDDIEIIPVKPEPWGISVSKERALALALEYIADFPESPLREPVKGQEAGWIKHYRMVLSRYAILTTALQVAQLEANDRLRSLLLGSSRLLDNDRDQPGILRFPEEEGHDNDGA